MKDITTVFLDRDGVINRLRSDYVLSWDAFAFLPHAKTAIRLLNLAGLRVVVVTNQRAVARGFISVAGLERIHEQMRAELAADGAHVDAIYYCPHDKGACECRKPKVGMFLQAQRDMPEIDFKRSLLIGDSLSDMQAGSALGCALMLVTETGSEEASGNQPSAAQAAGIVVGGVAPTLYDAVTQYILPALARPTSG